jgi:RNA polymerase-binding protein DksA
LLTKKDLKHYEDRLLEERKKLLGQLGYLERTLNQTQRDSAGDLSAYSFHMADMGTDAMEREKTFLFASAEGRLLYSVTEALRRIYRNEYGVCGSCGKDIGKARLEAIPHASLCVSCQEKQERETNTARG